jgi:hypothetical protein
MHALSNTDFLSLWERGRQMHPLDRGLLAIYVAFPEIAAESVADWPLGRRNRALVELRCSCFGSTLRAWTACAQCGEKVEFKLDARAMMAAGDPDHAPDTLTIGEDTFRLPTSRDLAAILVDESAARDPASGALRLARSCILNTTDSKGSRWSEEQLDEIGEKMAEADPLAEILTEFNCPACTAACKGALDLPAFLWTEIEAEVRRLLHDVHLLASGYGWTEAEILALSEPRRRLYTEMVRA